MANVGVHIPAPWFAYGEDIIGQVLHLVSAMSGRAHSSHVTNVSVSAGYWLSRLTMRMTVSDEIKTP
jgi:hypothetical protein